MTSLANVRDQIQAAIGGLSRLEESQQILTQAEGLQKDISELEHVKQDLLLEISDAREELTHLSQRIAHAEHSLSQSQSEAVDVEEPSDKEDSPEHGPVSNSPGDSKSGTEGEEAKPSPGSSCEDNDGEDTQDVPFVLETQAKTDKQEHGDEGEGSGSQTPTNARTQEDDGESEGPDALVLYDDEETQDPTLLTQAPVLGGALFAVGTEEEEEEEGPTRMVDDVDVREEAPPAQKGYFGDDENDGSPATAIASQPSQKTKPNKTKRARRVYRSPKKWRRTVITKRLQSIFFDF